MYNIFHNGAEKNMGCNTVLNPRMTVREMLIYWLLPKISSQKQKRGVNAK